jgi:hypothetical protein
MIFLFKTQLMRIFISILFIIASATTFSQLTNTEIKNFKTGKVKEDNSYVYGLPYAKGNKYLFIQGANSSFSHKAELAFDFKMKPGSKICAVRNGTVIATKADSDKGGLKPEYLSEGNHIIIQHEDGSVAQYWHLQKDGVIIKIGDTVNKGQLIGCSGNTGYTAFPHLHFQVHAADGTELLPRFKTKKGNIYLRPGRWYKAVNE